MASETGKTRADADQRYECCPLTAAGFSLVRFSVLGTRVFGADGRCICTAKDRCADVDKKDEKRCTIEQMHKLNSEAEFRRRIQSGDYD